MNTCTEEAVSYFCSLQQQSTGCSLYQPNSSLEASGSSLEVASSSLVASSSGQQCSAAYPAYSHDTEYVDSLYSR